MTFNLEFPFTLQVKLWRVMQTFNLYHLMVEILWVQSYQVCSISKNFIFARIWWNMFNHKFQWENFTWTFPKLNYVRSFFCFMVAWKSFRDKEHGFHLFNLCSSSTKNTLIAHTPQIGKFLPNNFPLIKSLPSRGCSIYKLITNFMSLLWGFFFGKCSSPFINLRRSSAVYS